MPTRRAAAAALVALVALALLPGVVAAHSELVTSDPADGTTLATPPTVITGEFSEEVDSARSSMELRAADGSTIATGGVPADGPATRMTLGGLPALAPGRYDVRWTTVTADDAGVERGTFTFTVAEAAATSSVPPAATPVPSATPAPEPAPATGTADLLLPILVLGAVLVAGVVVFLRRRR
jgi:LPXTG-motif cell wall-anchored protein